MQTLTAAQIRETYLRFFERHGHTIVPSSSLVVADDPTLLFVNSGMVPFKNLFLGLEQRPYTRAVTAQKCLRVSGKHNDLEEVGPSPRHQTFFEMLGNFSFGDYFKTEAIRLAWKLLTEEFKLPVERLWFTVFEGSPGIPADDEAAQLWQEAGVDPSRILRFGEKDNFWVMADTGPCGPNSEITFYIGDDLSKMSADGVNSDDPDYVEIWNNVFMQFERSTMQRLPRASIDTGMGLERMSMVMQGVHSTYETDLFRPVIERTMGLLGSNEAHYRFNLAPYRAVADHARAIAFLIAERVLPGNSGRSYVLRRILRRAAYQGRLIGFERPFLAEVVDTVIKGMGDAYPELRERREFILETTDTEEQQFLRTLSGGITKLNAIIEDLQTRGEATIPGVDAFRLKDTDGFPLDLIQKIAAEHNMSVDVAGFEAAMDEQRRRSRAATQFKRGIDAEIWQNRSLPPTEFTGYTELSSIGRVLALVADDDDVSTAQEGQRVEIVLDRTPFYAESGGQVGDTGLLIGPQGQVRVEDTLRPVPGVTIHYGRVARGQFSQGETVTAQVDVQRRADIQRNHTATHLLHRALRDVLGEHAAQAGSLVAPDRLRFDFTHTRAIEPEQLREIETRVNAWVRSDGAVTWTVTDYQTAIDNGAIALFGEKYGDQVRVVHIARDAQDTPSTRPTSQAPPDFASRDSVELCGGAHVARTGEIGYARIVSEGSVGSGLRRIEALTGRGAEAWVEAQAKILRDLAARLGVPPAQVAERVEALLTETKQRQQELDSLRSQITRGSLEGLLAQVQRDNGVALLTARVEASDATRLREMGDWLRDKIGSGVVVLGAVLGDKPQLLTIVTSDLVKQGYHAGNLVKELARIVGGGGGGRPDMAQAGGRDVSKLDAALAHARELVRAHGARSA
jgi:alanyl-tRNA synthetase